MAGQKTPEDIFPALCPEHFRKLAEAACGKSRLALLRQVDPDARELELHESETEDPLGEKLHSPIPGLVHRYDDRVLLRLTGRCAMHCRFCYRRALRGQWPDSAMEMDESGFARCLEYIDARPTIREVILSGGDPLMLEENRLSRIMKSLSDIKHLRILRLGTRVPVADPRGISPAFHEKISAIPGLWIVLHINHPAEFSPEMLDCCRRFREAGIALASQTVLLKGINDEITVLEELFARLTEHRIKPLYLFHLDPAPGTSHFATGLQAGLEIMRGLRKRVSSLSMPVFALDLPRGGGKVPLLPEYRKNGLYISPEGRPEKYDDRSRN